MWLLSPRPRLGREASHSGELREQWKVPSVRLRAGVGASWQRVAVKAGDLYSRWFEEEMWITSGTYINSLVVLAELIGVDDVARSSLPYLLPRLHHPLTLTGGVPPGLGARPYEDRL
jgi:hypothetical protein